MNISLIQDCLKVIDGEMMSSPIGKEELHQLREAYLQRVLFIEQQMKSREAA